MSRKFLTLVKRELWETRSLWIVPLAMASLIVLTMFFADDTGQGLAVRASSAGLQITPGTPTLGALSLIGMVGFISLGSSIAAFAYLLDCLFAERRDRSILFWKSLPVSDFETVMAKLVVALAVVPLLVVLAGLIAQPLVALITWIRIESLRPFIDFGLFADWPRILLRFLVVWLFSVLWFAPVAGYLMLASVLARRTPIMYAVLPPVVLIGIENMLSDTIRIAAFIGNRLFPWKTRLVDLFGPIAPNQPLRATTVESHWWVPFQDPALWLGVAAAAVILFAVTRLRRYRDDT